MKLLKYIIITLIFISPLGYIIAKTVLSIEPVDALLESTGYSSIALLLISVSTALLFHFRKHKHLFTIKKYCGFAALLYGAIHFSIYLILDQGLSIDLIIEDIIKHPRIIYGLTSLLLMIGAGSASLRFISKSRNVRKWLLRLSYPAGIFAALHYIQAVKFIEIQPLLFMVLFCTIAGVRLLLFSSRGNK